jgi:predicted RNA methylase
LAKIAHHDKLYENQEFGKISLSYHLEKVADSERVSLFKKGIDKIVNKDTIFCDLGCGTGIFSIYAAKIAKRVYAVEKDDNVFDIAKKNIKKSGLSEKIDLKKGDALQVKLPEKVDVIFCEMLSIWMIEDPQVVIMNYAVKELLKPNGIMIPEKVINLAELCNFDYKYDNVQIKASIAQFTGIKHPRIMTESNVFNIISFNKLNSSEVSHTIEFKILTSGLINSVRLSSIVKISDGINFYSTDSLMPLTIVPLKNELYVEEGQKVKLNVNYRHANSLDKVCFEIEECI